MSLLMRLSDTTSSSNTKFSMLLSGTGRLHRPILIIWSVFQIDLGIHIN